MGRVHYLARDEAAEPVRPIYDTVEKKLGFVPNMFKAMAQAPDMFQASMGLNATLSKTKLDPKLRELAYLNASTDRVDLEYRQRQIDRGLFRNRPLNML